MPTYTNSIHRYDPVQNVQPVDTSNSANDRTVGNDISGVAYFALKKNYFALAIENTLSEVGIFGTSGTSPGDLLPPNREQQQVVDYFIVNLLTSMLMQNSKVVEPQGDSTSITHNSGIVGVFGYEEHNYHHAGEPSNIQTDLQSLIQQISLTGNTSTESKLSSLEQSFEALFTLDIAPEEISRTQMTLPLFLIALSKNIEGIDSAGNFINLID